ncbi:MULTISPECIES: hypothetical protein [Bradyrhizobium]|uniref:hypothetical protein n=1 Tax=Bradyrhizobium elkanii TaxID=29448 RepID=UPI002714F1C6|nr:hypothetical protein [Bradyrhizobium elkanii]WLB84900.1 hypothetical protein QIH83_21070 [Bradyrhizobium elkanii]
MARRYLIDGVSMTAEEVGAIKNPTESQKKQFIAQSGISDDKLREIKAMVDTLFPVIREYVKKNLTPLVDRVAELQQKMVELEERPLVPWAGTWDSAKEFKRNTFCSDRGAMWFAMADSKGVRPGSGDGVWRLVVKAGRDGRDAAAR